MQHFASAPQAVGTRKGKYRDDVLDGRNNLMHDRRVVRGNTYASLVQPEQDMSQVQKQRDAQRRRLMRANQTKKRVGTPEAISGRKHMDIQTDSYLEELTERTVEFEAETQTDFLLDRPPSPLFMPAKIGVDIQTQIEDGDLFDFDVEVEPVLEVLVGKTLEQGMMEVLEEAELESLRRHQEDFEKRRNAELLEVQRMEAAEKRRTDEMERRMAQAAAQRKRDESTMKKVVSRSMAMAHLSSIKERALAHLMDAGVFKDATQLSVEEAFLPALMSLVTKHLESTAKDRTVASNVSQTAVAGRLAAHEGRLQAERARLAALDDAERKARAERQQEQLRLQAEKQRIADEQSAMMEWEQYQPPPPPEAQVTTIEEGNAVLADGTNMRIVGGEEAVNALQEMLNGLEEPNIIVGQLLEDADGPYIGEFRISAPEPAPAVEAEGDPPAEG